MSSLKPFAVRILGDSTAMLITPLLGLSYALAVAIFSKTGTLAY
jgi:hypothetical protein